MWHDWWNVLVSGCQKLAKYFDIFKKNVYKKHSLKVSFLSPLFRNFIAHSNTEGLDINIYKLHILLKIRMDKFKKIIPNKTDSLRISKDRVSIDFEKALLE